MSVQARWALGFRLGRAFMLLASVGCALLLAAPAAAEEVKVSDDAARRFREGVRYLQTEDPQRYAKAYREFKAAYADSPSWKILGNLGIVAMELERDGEAIEAFTKYLEGGKAQLEEEERVQVTSDIALVESRSASVTLNTGEGSVWVIDRRIPESGEPIVNRYGPAEGRLELRVRAGRHRIHLERPSGDSEPWEFTTQAGTKLVHAFEEEKPSPMEPSPSNLAEPQPFVDNGASTPTMRYAGYVGVGVGVAGLALSTLLLLDWQDASADAQSAYDACADARRMMLAAQGQSPLPGTVVRCADPAGEENDELHDRAVEANETANTALTRTWIAYGVSGAVLGTGILLWALSGDDVEQAEDLAWWVGPRSLGVRGRF